MEQIVDRIYAAYLESHCVTTDSRAITPGCVFFAFKGERFDGNAFAPQALEQGAAMCVISDGRYRVDDRCVVVDDVLKTLQAVAVRHRRSLAIPVVGITGTNGKTTTKELVHAVLSRKYRTSATAGNFNNHLGVPLTLLAIPEGTEVAIVEMGANHPGEIEQLCNICDPDFGLITNCGRAHLEGFGSFEGVVRTKTELYRHMAPKHGTIFVNADNATLMREAERLATIPTVPTTIPAYMPGLPMFIPQKIDECPLSVVTYGGGEGAEVRGTYVGSKPYMKFYFEDGDSVYTVQSRLLGAYNFDNAMAAVCVGMHFGVEPFAIKEAIEAYTPSNQRSEMRATASNRLYLDCYNANPSSMEAAIATFDELEADRKAAIIGGMHELGKDSRSEHKRLVERLAGCQLERILLIGPEFEGLRLEGNMTLLPDTEAAAEELRRDPMRGYTILVKGSNTNRLWQLESLL